MRTAMLQVTSIVLLSFLVTGCAGRAGSGGWVHLGTKTVHGRADRDEILVTGTQGTFRKLRFEVEGSALEMHDVVVVFRNGERFSPATRFVFSKRSGSRVIDLPGRARTIRKVVFRYGNLRGGGRARLSLMGR